MQCLVLFFIADIKLHRMIKDFKFFSFHSFFCSIWRLFRPTDESPWCVCIAICFIQIQRPQNVFGGKGAENYGAWKKLKSHNNGKQWRIEFLNCMFVISLFCRTLRQGGSGRVIKMDFECIQFWCFCSSSVLFCSVLCSYSKPELVSASDSQPHENIHTNAIKMKTIASSIPKRKREKRKKLIRFSPASDMTMLLFWVFSMFHRFDICLCGFCKCFFSNT